MSDRICIGDRIEVTIGRLQGHRGEVTNIVNWDGRIGVFFYDADENRTRYVRAARVVVRRPIGAR